jgi:hypothetical protein
MQSSTPLSVDASRRPGPSALGGPGLQRPSALGGRAVHAVSDRESLLVERVRDMGADEARVWGVCVSRWVVCVCWAGGVWARSGSGGFV